jgi:hypothetical protein
MRPFPRKYAVLAVCAGIVLSVVGASPAGATSAYLFRTRTSYDSLHPEKSLCMDVSFASTANGTAIKQWPCNANNLAQRWTLEYVQRVDNLVYYQLVSSLSPQGNPKCLDLPWGNPAAGQTVQLWDCLGAARQLWRWEQIPNAPYDYTLRNLQTDQCLDVPWADPVAGAQLWQWPCNGTEAQQWYETSG